MEKGQNLVLRRGPRGEHFQLGDQPEEGPVDGVHHVELLRGAHGGVVVLELARQFPTFLGRDSEMWWGDG